MTWWLWLAVVGVVVVFVCCGLLMYRLATIQRRRRGITLQPVGDGWIARTPSGLAVVRRTVHEDMGRVYEVRFRLPGGRFGQPTYCLPSEVMLRKHLTDSSRVAPRSKR